MVCQFLLYNKVNQLYINIYPLIPSLLSLPPTLPFPPLQVDTKHRADLLVLCGCFPLTIYFTFGSVYTSMPLSHFVPVHPYPSLCPRVHSLHLHLYSCLASRFFRTLYIFLDSIYMCQHTVFVFLFLTYVTRMTVSRSIHVAANGRISFFLWLSSIPLYIHSHTQSHKHTSS